METRKTCMMAFDTLGSKNTARRGTGGKEDHFTGVGEDFWDSMKISISRGILGTGCGFWTVWAWLLRGRQRFLSFLSDLIFCLLLRRIFA